MCLGAIMWAKIPKLYYGCTAADAAEIGFDDDYIYDFIKKGFEVEKPKLVLQSHERENCLELFRNWTDKNDRNMY